MPLVFQTNAMWKYFVCLLTIITACKTKNVAEGVTYTGEQTIVYKTVNDYHEYVPVTMNTEKTEIVAYPSPKDVYRNGQLALPTTLANGYWLDNRGVNANTVFLNITYREYAQLTEAPSLQKMLDMIKDKNPFESIYNLGTRNRFKDEVSEINYIIKKNLLQQFKKVK